MINLPYLDAKVLEDIVVCEPPGATALELLWTIKMIVGSEDQVEDTEFWRDKISLLLKLLAMSIVRLAAHKLIELREGYDAIPIGADTEIWRSIVDNMERGLRPDIENVIVYRFFPTHSGCSLIRRHDS